MQRIWRIVRGVAVSAGLVALAGGCASINDHRGYFVDKALVDSVQPGVDNKLSVELTLGRPTFISQFGEPSWYYVSMDTEQKPMSMPKAYQQMVMRIRFDPDGNVMAIDRAGLEHAVRIDPDGDETPTLGRDRSFFEDLFGNIGSVGAGGGPGGGAGGSN